MKTVKLIIVLIGFTFMSTGCRHDHHEHGKNSSKAEKSDHSNASNKEGKHRH